MLKTEPKDKTDIGEIRLDPWLRQQCSNAAVAEVLNCFAAAAADVADLVARGPLAGALGAVVGGNTDGDAQKDLDLRADRIFREALRNAPIAALASEEAETATPLQAGAPLVAAIDPLDGSSNIDTNVTIGSIVSILPNTGDDVLAALLQPGERQMAAAFAVYGPQTALALTIGTGTHIFTLDRRGGAFVLTRPNVQIPLGQREYAINASNYRHWHAPIRAYIDDCISGADGPRGENFNMRWIASLVAEAYRILARGGIFLYPRDDRPAYSKGRLRLVYEASPIAFLVEQAGGGATDGQDRILDMRPSELHGRVPLVFGSRDKVERVARYHQDRHGIGERSPLFGKRDLFRP